MSTIIDREAPLDPGFVADLDARLVSDFLEEKRYEFEAFLEERGFEPTEAQLIIDAIKKGGQMKAKNLYVQCYEPIDQQMTQLRRALVDRIASEAVGGPHRDSIFTIARHFSSIVSLAAWAAAACLLKGETDGPDPG